jgi:hypothetical protein
MSGNDTQRRRSMRLDVTVPLFTCHVAGQLQPGARPIRGSDKLRQGISFHPGRETTSYHRLRRERSRHIEREHASFSASSVIRQRRSGD